MKIKYNIFREIPILTDKDCFLINQRVKDEFNYPLHYHSEFELNFIKNGKGSKRIIGNHMEEIKDLELVLVGSNLEHVWETYKCKNKGIFEVTIQFDQHLFEDALLSRSILKPIKDMFERSSRGILFSYETTKMLEERITNLPRLDGMDCFIEMISLLYDLATSRKQRILSSSSFGNEFFDNDDKMLLVYNYIQKKYSEKITLEDVSKVALMSPISFNRFIKKRTNKTFVNYLNDVRIGHAAKNLIEKDLSVSEIAFKCGFNNIANFNRIFKSVKGVTPSKYREEFNGIRRIL